MTTTETAARPINLGDRVRTTDEDRIGHVVAVHRDGRIGIEYEDGGSDTYPAALVEHTGPILTDVPDYAEAWVRRLVGYRRDGAARRVKSPEGSAIIRCSWLHTGIHGRGGTATNEVIRWVVWVDGKFRGGYDFRRAALVEAADR